MSRRALIVGLGLIGGSVGKALSQRGWDVGYVDPEVELEAARRAGAAARRAAGPHDEDVVILATPADAAVSLLPTLRQASLVTSVCSVMGPLRRAAGDVSFVAGHPMAGSHERGLAAARGDLFEGKPWFVDAPNPVIEEVVRDCGGKLRIVDPEEHDAAVALTSHLPQLLSTALAASVEPDVAAFSGSGLTTFLRLAESDPAVWRPVFDANRSNIEAALQRVLAVVSEILDGNDAAFDKARDFLRMD